MKLHPDELDHTILLELRKYPPSTMRQIGEVIHRSHITVRQRMRWLEQNKFVTQASNVPKGAARSKVLSEKGFAYLDDPTSIYRKPEHAEPVPTEDTPVQDRTSR